MPVGAAVVLGFTAGIAFADEAEDNSAAFQADLARTAAENGVADAASTVTTHSNGMMSAVAGLEHMKMLVVRKNADGTLSYGHVDSQQEADEFAASDADDFAAEEE